MALNSRNTVRRLDSAKTNLDDAQRLESQVWKLKQKANASMRKVRDELQSDEQFKTVVANIVIESHKLGCSVELVAKNIKVEVSNATIVVSIQYGNWGIYGHRIEEAKTEFDRLFNLEIPKYLKIPAKYIKCYLWADHSDDK